MKIKLPIRKPALPFQRPPKLKLKASVARRRAPIIEDEDDFLDEPEPNMKLSHAFVVVLVLHVIAVAGVFAFNSIKARQAEKAEIFAATKEDVAQSASATNETGPATPGASDPSNGTGSAQSGDPATSPAAPAAAASPTPSTQAVGSAKTHEMQPGETLTKVATEYGVTINALEKANNITDPKKIRAGTVLTIPEGGTAPATTRPTAETTQPAAVSATPAAVQTDVKDSGQVYTVAKGDNPVKIAKKLKVPYAELMSLNGNPDPRKLQIGQKLKIPAGSTTTKTKKSD